MVQPIKLFSEIGFVCETNGLITIHDLKKQKVICSFNFEKLMSGYYDGRIGDEYGLWPFLAGYLYAALPDTYKPPPSTEKK